MPIFCPFFDGILVECVSNQYGQPAVNVLWFFKPDGGVTNDDLTDAGAGVATWYSANVRPLMSSETTFLGTRAYDASLPYPSPQVQTVVNLPGGFFGPAFSANVSVRTNFKSKSFGGLVIGSNFFAGLPREVVSSNVVDPSWANDLREAYIVLLDVFSFAFIVWVGTSRFLNNSPRAERAFTIINGIRVNLPYVAQRRKRLNPRNAIP